MCTYISLLGSKGFKMSKKSLLESNPYLKDPAKYHDALITSVSSSTAIETATSTLSVAQSLKGIFEISKKKPVSSR